MKGDYKNGRIYKIEPICDHEENEVYYGSTSQKLCKRMDSHRGNYKQWKNGKNGKVRVYNLFDKYGIENCKIYLVEDFPCERKEQLIKREGEIIKANHCINKNLAGRNRRQYKIDNKDKIKKYYNDNKDKIAEQKKKYRKENKDKILEKNKKKFNCECGSCFRYADKKRHNKSIKHKTYQQMANQLAVLNKMHNEIITKHKQLYFS